MNKPAIRLCVFDVDGTLYDKSQHQILDSTIQALHQLKENGIKIAVATGRSHYALGRSLNELAFDYVCAVNGAVLVDQKQHILVRHDFSRDDVEQINHFAYQHQAGLAWKFIDHVYLYQHKEKIDWLEGQMKSDVGSLPFVDCLSQDHHLVDLPQSASLHAPADLVEAFFGHSDRIAYMQFSQTGFDVFPKEVNKGSGLVELMKIMNIQQEEVMVFGDHFNDLAMFEQAAHRIAMGNAIDEVKQAATFITRDCAHDGIAYACQHFHLI